MINKGRSCTVEGCTKSARTRGWCSMHYERWRVLNTPTPPPVAAPCSIDGCHKDATARGWCSMHWWRWRNHGHPLALKKPTSMLERIKAKVAEEPGTGCWVWQGTISKSGYGRFYDPETQTDALAHRLAYEAMVGPIPDGLTLDHLCRVTRCVNPRHLEPVTLAENIRRAAAATTHCPQGHAYGQDNTYRDPSGSRRCRACHREEQRERYHRAKNGAV